MTERPKPTPISNPWDLATTYAASYGLFAPGALMAARLRAAEHNSQSPSPTKG